MTSIVRSFIWLTIGFVTIVFALPSTVLAQGKWDTRSSDGFRARESFSATAVSNLIYTIGGRSTSGEAGSEIQVYDSYYDKWSDFVPQGPEFKRASHHAILVGRKIYCFGGVNEAGDLDSSVWIFDANSRAWSSPTTSGSWTPRFDFAAQIVGNKIYVIGGTADYSVPSGMDVFDVTTNTWSQPTTTGPYDNAVGATSAVVDGKIYVMGGFTAAGNELDVRMFDPATNVWSVILTKGGLMGPARYPTCEVLNDKIYMMGGSLDADNLIKEVKIFEPSTSKVRLALNSGSYTGRIDPRSTSIGDKFYLLGGYDPDIIKIGVLDLFFPLLSDVAEDATVNTLSVYPNPARGSIVLGGIPEDASHVAVFTLLGEKVRDVMNPTAGMLQIDLEGLNASTYIVRVSTPTSVHAQIFVKD